MQHDREAFLATVAPGDRAFERDQTALFEGWAGVHPSTYDLEAQWDRAGDLVRPMDVARYPDADAVSIPVTEERYRLAGFDRSPAVEDLYLTFVRIDGRWYVASDDDLAAVGLRSTRHLWERAPVESETSGRFRLMGHRCSSAGASCPVTAHDYLGSGRAALARVDEYWRYPWNRRLVMMVPNDADELKAMIQATFDVDSFVAFAYANIDPERGFRYVGDRIILNPGGFAGRTQDEVVEILAHEMLHVATRAVSGPFVPVWLDEGLADYVGSDASPTALDFFEGALARGLVTGTIPRDYSFMTGTGTQIYLSYQTAQSAVRFFIDRWGRARLERLYRLLGSRRIAAGTARFHVDRAFHRTTGHGFAGFQRAWADSIH
ncbi:MAG TPA: hypothetical protein VFK89_09690 [Actinomycetota bacterium]|nr:hypothetical protein [Actinomycetota bacterium]